MMRWLFAALVGAIGAWVAYGPLWRSASAQGAAAPSGPTSEHAERTRPVLRGPAAWLLALLRGAAYTLLVAMLIGAPMGAPVPLAPLPALDASASWDRAQVDGEGGLARVAMDSLQALPGDSVLLLGDSARLVSRAEALDTPMRDQHSRLQSALDHPAALGRSLVLLTDGEIDDPGALSRLPAGSRVVRPTRAPSVDLALSTLELPAIATGGDTLEVVATIVTAGDTVRGATLEAALENSTSVRVSIQQLDPFSSRRLSLRLPVPRGTASSLITVAVHAPNDAEPQNDTLIASLEISDRPRVVFITTLPDLDVREVLRVLRGSVQFPTRGYLRVAPGIWREEGSLASIAESVVQQRAREAGVLVLHGDTAWNGIAQARRGATMLWAPAPPPRAPRAGEIARPLEWFVFRAPPSPLSDLLSLLPFDSLPPIEIGEAIADTASARGTLPLLEARAGRSGAGQVIATSRMFGGTRQLRLTGSGFASWALRGGRSADAFSALFGSLFDWLAVAERDGSGAWLEGALYRAGEPLVWHRGGGDSAQLAILTTSNGRADSVTLRFGDGVDQIQSSPLAEGRYTLRVGATSRALVVNGSRELVPRAPEPVPTISSVGAPSLPPRPLLERSWLIAIVLTLLSVEWFARRGVGLR